MTSVRPAIPQDAADIVAVRYESWRATYGPYLPAHVWDGIDPAAVERLAGSIEAGTMRVLVADADDTIVGYSFSGAARDDDLPDGTGEVYAIYVHPSSWSTGAGRALMTATLDALGETPVVVWVLENNARARRFYDLAGFAADGTIKPAEMPGGVTLPEVRYRRG